VSGQLCLAGEVVSGRGEAAFFTRLEWVCRRCRRELGFEPYPGTLNVRIFSDHLAVLEELEGLPGVALVPPTDDFCSGRALPVQVGGIPAALIIPEKVVRTHGPSIVEIIAPMCLRDTLGLADGDRVEIVLRITD
jgi:CTP-dependent riboflavin kinase